MENDYQNPGRIEVEETAGFIQGWQMGEKFDLDDWAAAAEIAEIDDFLDSLPDKNYATIGRIKVDEAARGKGLGKGLLEKLSFQAQERGVTALILLVYTGESQLKGFDLVRWYEAQGFENIWTNKQDMPVMLKIL